MARETMLARVRKSLGRAEGQNRPPAPEPYLPERSIEDPIAAFCAALEKLAGKTYIASSPEEARKYVATLIEGKRAIASNAPFLRECGIDSLPDVRSGFQGGEDYRAACAAADVGITSADYALSDTGSLVMLSSACEARMISLLPPLHIAIVPGFRVLTNLDELIRTVPQPAELTSSMVLITGPSRTADIEQILVRGVHGPAEIHVVVVTGSTSTK